MGDRGQGGDIGGSGSRWGKGQVEGDCGRGQVGGEGGGGGGGGRTGRLGIESMYHIGLASPGP